MREIKFTCNGIEIVLFSPDNDHITKCIEHSGFYELGMLDHSKSKLKKKPIIIDAGANIGNHTVFWSKMCDAEVHAFEPCVEAFTFLEKNVESNNVDAHLHNCALSDREGIGQSKAVKGNLGQSKFFFNVGTTPMNTLDSFKIEPDLIKVDVEGMELDVLHGAVKTLVEFKPMLYVETDNQEVFDYLDMLGYKKLQRFNATPTWFFDRREK